MANTNADRRKTVDINKVVEAIEKQQTSLAEFVTIYERDMRGDMNCGNGEKGLVGEIRAIKEYMKDYPTIGYQFKKTPFKVIGIVSGLFFIMYVVFEAGAVTTGVFPIILKLLGI